MANEVIRIGQRQDLGNAVRLKPSVRDELVKLNFKQHRFLAMFETLEKAQKESPQAMKYDQIEQWALVDEIEVTGAVDNSSGTIPVGNTEVVIDGMMLANVRTGEQVLTTENPDDSTGQLANVTRGASTDGTPGTAMVAGDVLKVLAPTVRDRQPWHDPVTRQVDSFTQFMQTISRVMEISYHSGERLQQTYNPETEEARLNLINADAFKQDIENVLMFSEPFEGTQTTPATASEGTLWATGGALYWAKLYGRFVVNGGLELADLGKAMRLQNHIADDKTAWDFFVSGERMDEIGKWPHLAEKIQHGQGEDIVATTDSVTLHSGNAKFHWYPGFDTDGLESTILGMKKSQLRFPENDVQHLEHAGPEHLQRFTEEWNMFRTIGFGLRSRRGSLIILQGVTHLSAY